MFDAIAIRRTAPYGAPGGPIDLGRLAEAMLFYRKVRLAVTRHSLQQLIVSLGPAAALEIAKNPSVDLIYLDRDFALRTEDRGTAHERHRPVTITVMESVRRGNETVNVPQPLDSLVVDMFREATGKSGAGRRMADRFLGHLAVHEFDPGLLGLVQEDWADDDFVRQMIIDSVKEFAPEYSIPSDFKASLTQTPDEHFRLETNLDWAALLQGADQGVAALRLDPVTLLLSMVEMRQDLALAATLGTSLAQDRLGERIMRTKCKELLAQLEGQQVKIDEFQSLVVKGIGNLGGAINSGRRSFREFLAVLEKAEHFRAWLDKQVPTSDLVATYYAEAFKKTPFEKLPLNKELSWVLPAATVTAAVVRDP